MEIRQLIYPIVYSHFLRCFCHYQLKNSRHCWDSILDLQVTIKENYLNATHNLKGLSHNILGKGFQLLGDIEAARQACMHSIELFSDQKKNVAFQKLSFIS